MMLYLTGAASSLANSPEAPQIDVSKSLGGYISSSVVPNGSLNALFDMISLTTLKNKPKELVGLGLINKFDYAVSNVELRIVTKPDYVGKFKVAATAVGDDYMMEHVANRYSEPMQAEFNDVDFYRAAVTGEIVVPAVSGEVISIQPFDINVEVESGGMEGTMDALVRALSSNLLYGIRKLSNTRFELFSKEDTLVDEPITCIAVGTEGVEINFLGEYKNGKNNTALVADTIVTGQAIGIWLQREIVPAKFSNEEIVKMHHDGVVVEQEEDVEFLITYDIPNNSVDNQDNGENEGEGDNESIADNQNNG